MALSSILSMLGGIGLFLYGMKLMGQSLERSAGAKLEQTLANLTSSTARGVALGTGVTAVIQSSAATTLMVVGFLNAGIMNLMQAVPVILGANIGTTVTAQILRLGDIGSSGFVSMLKPTSFAPILTFVAAFVMLSAKRNKIRDRAGIAMGLGILFIGMGLMEQAFAPLAESEEFMELLLLFKNPILGLLAGIVLTALLQSSSASVGVIQALTATGAVTFASAAPLVLGANMGRVIPVILGSIGSNKNAKRAVVYATAVSAIGALFVIIVVYAYHVFVGFSFWDKVMTRGTVADFHTVFNIVNCVIMLPFTKQLVSFCHRVVKDDPNEVDMDAKLQLLDDRFLAQPAVALDQCKAVILAMGQACKENFAWAMDLCKEYDEKKRERMLENERFLDKSESALGSYLLKITGRHMNTDQSFLTTEMLHTVSDFERIGDHCDNLGEVAEYNRDQGIRYSDMATQELESSMQAVADIIDLTVKAYEENSYEICREIWPLEDVIDDMVDQLKSNHVARLKKGNCNTQSGISFVEMLTNMERISDHCNNIAIHLSQRVTHGTYTKHSKDFFDKSAPDFVHRYRAYVEHYGIDLKADEEE